MKKSFYLIVCAAALFVLGSCQKLTTEGMTRTTYYPVIDLEGGNPFVVPVGQSYVEPGFTATLGGEDISDAVSISSNVNTSTMGVYQVTYSAVNEDGFSGSLTRTVVVANPGSIETVYDSHSIYGSRQYHNPLSLTEVSDGVYAIDDIMGGFYCLGRYPGYEVNGYDFWGEGTFQINEDNTLSLLSVGPWYFLNSFDYSTFEGTYDPETGAFAWTIEGDFFVTLTPYSN